jgi:hypothetical protein
MRQSDIARKRKTEREGYIERRRDTHTHENKEREREHRERVRT